MALIKYQVIEKSFIVDRFYDPAANPDEPLYVELPDTVVPGPNLKAIDDKGKAAKAKFKELCKADAKRMSLAADGVENLAEVMA